MYKISKLLLSIVLILCGLANVSGQNELTYGFIQDSADPLEFTAVAYPNFTSNNVTFSTGRFSFLLPAGTTVDPNVEPLPAQESFENETGQWIIQLMTSTSYETIVDALGQPGDASDLEGNDIYTGTLLNIVQGVQATAGQPIELFTFRLPNNCSASSLQIVENDSPIRQAVLDNTLIEISNQFFIGVDGSDFTNHYVGNDLSSSSFTCPINAATDEAVARVDEATTNSNTAVEIDVLSNDDFGTNGAGSISIITIPANGTASIDDGGTPGDPTDDVVTYTPEADFFGVDEFTYEICDANTNCSQAVVTVDVISAMANAEVTYGFIQNPNNLFEFTAVAYPNFSSDDVVLSTGSFTFLLPTGTTVDPSIPPLEPGTFQSGSFNNETGQWEAQLLTASGYEALLAA